VSEAERWTRVKEIFDAVVAGRVEDRATLVREMCADDRALQTDVESLLAADAGHGSVFDAPVDRDIRGRVFSAVAGALDRQTATFAPGERFGAYEITALLGAGGMGLVYRARDTTLGREVALKILPDVWLADPDRRARFEREARVLASLNHPNIGSIYGVHESEPSPSSGLAVKALVLELVEGETLADRIALHAQPTASRRGMPIDDVVGIASQLIEALEAAHASGIVHRDLKPANIKIRPDERVKVLDFGLAKEVHGAGSELQTVNAVTGTEIGVLLGTARYMSPEQALGKVVDKRTDIWAFGCVLYEMVAGVPAFAGDGVAEVLANVIKSEPDWTVLPADVPAALRLCLQRCLQKDLRQRFHDISDVRLAMQGAFEPPAFAMPAPLPRQAVSRRLIAVLAVVSVLIGAVATTVLWDSDTVTATKLILGLPGGTAPQYNVQHFALAPDGSQFVYVGPDGRLWARDLAELEPRALAGTDEASAPFFSPDGRSMGFVAGRALKVLPVQGGSVRTVAASSMNVLGGDWAPDGMLYFSSSAKGVWRVAATGGTVEPVSRPDLGVTHRVMDVLPGGKGALLTIENESVNTSQIGLLDFSTGEVQSLFPGTQARFATSGHVLYTTADGTLHAVPFDQHRLRITGRAVPLSENVEGGVYNGPARFALSDNGTFVYQRKSVRESEAVWVARDGTAAPLTPEPWRAEFFSLSLSPDGKQLAATLTTGTRQDIWTRSLETGALNRLTFDNDGSLNYRAKWTADGRVLTFISNRSGTAGELWRQLADGSARAERLVTDGPIIDEGLISPDGHWAVYRAGGSEVVSRDIKAVRLGNGAGTSPTALVATRSDEYSPALSADGRWFAYVSQESGRPEVYVRPFPETQNAVWQVSRGGGQGPVWARSGQLFYQNLRRELMAVATRGSGTFEWDPPQVLFDASNYVFNPWHPTYDVTPDGEKFLMARRVGRPGVELVLVLNWFHELKRELAGMR
jgi:eukaryotic-like serine/threonine-protein kinase